MSAILFNMFLSWDLGSFLKNATETLKTWGGYFIILIGVIMLIVGVYQLASGLWSHGKKQTNWFIVVCLFIIGGAFMVGGFSFVSKIASGGQKTIEDLGETIIPMLPMFFR